MPRGTTGDAAVAMPTAVAVLAAGDDDDDRPRRRWPWVLLGFLLLAAAATGGTFAYLANRTVTHVMPALVGQTVADLQRVADENEWVLGDEKTLRSDEIASVVRVLRDVLVLVNPQRPMRSSAPRLPVPLPATADPKKARPALDDHPGHDNDEAKMMTASGSVGPDGGTARRRAAHT